ncbi:MAG: riboflavin synthase [Marinoscillum sp.]|jgi:riboflavin synthase
MFTGIVESIGNLKKTQRDGTNLHLKISSEISNELKVDQSVSHNGICLTVTKIEEDGYWVTAIDETLSRTNLKDLQIGDDLNLERCMVMNGRLDGHIVQGHVDTVARVKDIKDVDGSWIFSFQLGEPAELMVEKGSVCVNGVSLTCFEIGSNSFKVGIIPYTFNNTNFHRLKIDSLINIEFDIIGKYIKKLTQT